MTDAIPMVDFSKLALGVDITSVGHSQLSLIGEDIRKAFTQHGFCYLYNHGIPHEEIQDVFSVSRQFFEQPVATKEKYSMPAVPGCGWIAQERERLDKLDLGVPVADLKESYKFNPDANPENIPIDVVPNFKTSFERLYEDGKELALRLLDITSIAIELPSKEFLRDTHRFIGSYSRNPSIIKSLIYPAATGNEKPGQVRCGEHTDYGTLTFIFQDNTGGLQVMNSSGEYIAARPVEGAIVVLIGDMIQRWTADKIRATKHKALIPEEQLKTMQARQSIAFFIQPDDDVIIKCLDGSDKYESITFKNYLSMKLTQQY